MTLVGSIIFIFFEFDLFFVFFLVFVYLTFLWGVRDVFILLLMQSRYISFVEYLLSESILYVFFFFFNLILSVMIWWNFSENLSSGSGVLSMVFRCSLWFSFCSFSFDLGLLIGVFFDLGVFFMLTSFKLY